MRTIDWKQIIVKAGNGGRGCISFDRGAFVPFGKPDGGNGSKGASIFFKATENVLHFGALKSLYEGPAGKNGRNQGRHGKKPEDVVVNIPIGSIVKVYKRTYNEKPDLDPHQLMRYALKRWNSGAVEDTTTFEEDLIKEVDFSTKDHVALIAKGGNGGKGNPFYSRPGASPRKCGLGEVGQCIRVEMNLKTLADIGLVGFPNSGKSSLVGALTNHKPKVANYAFTTLDPSIGISLSENYFLHNSKDITPNKDYLRIADIPGLIEGASDNKGLGHRFLKHIERCKLLIFVMDAYPEYQTKEPFEMNRLVTMYNTLLTELRKYDSTFVQKPRVLVFNKIDLLNTASKLRLEQTKRILNEKILCCSVMENLGIRGMHGLGVYILNQYKTGVTENRLSI